MLKDFRGTAKILRGAGHSFVEILRKVGCGNSTAYWTKTGLMKTQNKTGQPRKVFGESKEERHTTLVVRLQLKTSESGL